MRNENKSAEHIGGLFGESNVESSVSETDSKVITLRDYQQESVSSTWKSLRTSRGVLTVMATGTGKSLCLADLVKKETNRGGKVLILVHRMELIKQLSASLSLMGVPCGIEQAERNARNGFGVYYDTVIASVQTLSDKRLNNWKRNSFSLVIIDECHHALDVNRYGDILRYFGYDEGACNLVGYTATPDRLDKQNIGQLFTDLAYEYNIRDAISDGWLSPIQVQQLETDPPIDISMLRTINGDLPTGELERIIIDSVEPMANAIRQTGALEDRRTIGFTPNVASAEALSNALNDVGISSQWISGNDINREQKIKDHKAGRYQALINCMILTEGYDDPAVSAIIMARPTKSRALYSQVVGRGTRLFPDKLNCRIVDFTYITGKHKLVSPVDLYDNRNVNDEVIAKARELVKEEGIDDIEEAIERAEDLVEEEKRKRVYVQKRQVRVSVKQFDPVSAMNIYGIERKVNYNFMDNARATDRQMNALQKWGITDVGDIGKGTASQILSKIFSRNEHGWASPNSIKRLVDIGYDVEAAKAMREKEARQVIANSPSSGQIWLLKKHGYDEKTIKTWTRKEASNMISRIKGNN